MDMTGEYRILAPRDRVWAALNDPEILKQAIPGCEELKRISDNELEASVRSKIGPVSARFSGKVTLSDLNPPESYRISGEGKGGAAGFAKGGANVSLAEEGSDLQQFGESASIMWLFHGWLFMVYVVVAFLLARRARWSVGFTVLMLVAGLVPLLIFWVEHRVVQKLRAENPELVGSSPV